jgi:hypothetical protein
VLCFFLVAKATDAFCSVSHRRSVSGCFLAFLSSSRQEAHRIRGTSLRGILDEINSDSYNLLSTTGGDSASDINMNDSYEMFLADLVFSTNDPRVDIVNKIDLAGDPAFIEWLQDKIGKSRDPEERIALRDLFDMIEDIKTRLEVNKLSEERVQKEKEEAEVSRLAQAESQADEGRSMSTTDILKKANAIDTAEMDLARDVSKNAKKKKTFYETELTPEIRLSYEGLLKRVMPPFKAGETFASIVLTNYDQFDAQFVKLLNERSQSGDGDVQSLLSALAVEQKKRIAVASDTLKEVLSQRDPMRMEGAIVKLARDGKVDEAFLLLVEANENQAKSAGANGAAELMKRLRMRAIEEKDKQSTSKEIRLLRQLLRTDDGALREKLLEDAFTPKDSLIVPGTTENAMKAADGEAPAQQKPLPEVPPPDFINACKAVLLNFGNLGAYDESRGDLATRIKKLASEAEVVATRIYGSGMTLREQQDRMWKDATTSIFDLETMEIHAERTGERAPWASEADDDSFLPGFDSKGRMQVGGS